MANADSRQVTQAPTSAQLQNVGWNPGYILGICVVGLLSIVLALGSFGQEQHFVFIWPATGVLLGVAAPRWRQDLSVRLLTVLAAMLSVAASGLLVGMPLWLAVQTGILTGVDLCLAGVFLFPVVSCFADLKRRQGVVRFALSAVLIPLCTASLGTPTLHGYLHRPALQTWMHAFFANSLGIALAFPVSLLFLRREEVRRWVLKFSGRRALPALLLFTAVAGWAFWQDREPFLFLVFPPMIVALLVLGLDGAVIVSLLVSVIGWGATTHGHGPMWLIRGASDDQRLLVLQIFVWTCLVTALPVGALLDERRAAEHKADEARAIYQTMLHNAEEMIVLSAIEGSQRYVSPAVERLTGWTPEEYLALNRLDTFHPDDLDLVSTTLDSLRHGKWEHTLRYRLLQKRGGYRWVEATVRAYGDKTTGSVAGYVGAVRDISELRRTETRWAEERAELTREQQRLADLASTDALTGLPNRRAFEQLLSNYEFDMRRQADLTAAAGLRAGAERKLTVMMVDVDYFKLYNDTYGHAAGDECLAELASILRSTLSRRDDVIARLGGEEFAIVLPGAGQTAAPAIAERLLQAVRVAQRTHRASPLGHVTISIGVAVGEPAADFSYAHLLQQADRALYVCKGAGKNRAEVSAWNCATPEVVLV